MIFFILLVFFLFLFSVGFSLFFFPFFSYFYICVFPFFPFFLFLCLLFPSCHIVESWNIIQTLMKKKVNIFMVLFQHMVPILVIDIFCDWHQLSITRSPLTKKKIGKVKNQRKLIKKYFKLFRRTSNCLCHIFHRMQSIPTTIQYFKILIF